MLTEQARVVAVDDDSVWVETIRQSTCGSCAVQKGCGHGLLNQIYPGRRNYIRVLTGDFRADDCRVDDEVIISIPEEVILRGSFVAYLLPLLCMIAGAALAAVAVPLNQDVAAALGAVAGIAVGFALVRRHARAHRDDSYFQPTLQRILRSGTEPVRVS